MFNFRSIVSFLGDHGSSFFGQCGTIYCYCIIYCETKHSLCYQTKKEIVKPSSQLLNGGKWIVTPMTVKLYALIIK